MSTQRICDLDATIIYPQTDLFYTVTDSRTGVQKDICAYCAQTRQLVPWAASVGATAGVKIRPVAGVGKYVFVATNTGLTGATEPAWPTTNGHAGEQITDNEVVWQVFPAPQENAKVTIALPGTTNVQTTMFGWMAGTNEPS
jgi:hypothetical protein